jgi:hypothetical protein
VLGAGVQVNAQGGECGRGAFGARGQAVGGQKISPFAIEVGYLIMDHIATDGSGTEPGTLSYTKTPVRAPRERPMARVVPLGVLDVV